MQKETLLSVIDEVEAEALRFIKKLTEYRDRANEEGFQPNNYCPNTKQAGALRRSAIDLKDSLTKITQSTNY